MMRVDFEPLVRSALRASESMGSEAEAVEIVSGLKSVATGILDDGEAWLAHEVYHYVYLALLEVFPTDSDYDDILAAPWSAPEHPVIVLHDRCADVVCKAVLNGVEIYSDSEEAREGARTLAGVIPDAIRRPRFPFLDR